MYHISTQNEKHTLIKFNFYINDFKNSKIMYNTLNNNKKLNMCKCKLINVTDAIMNQYKNG